MRPFFTSNPDEAFEFLATKSFRTFNDIENEEAIEEKLFEMPLDYETKWEGGEFKTFSELESEFKRELSVRVEKVSGRVSDIFSSVQGSVSASFRRWSDSCNRGERLTQSKECRTAARREPQQRSNCRKAQTNKRKSCIAEIFEIGPGESSEAKGLKTRLNETVIEDLQAGTEYLEGCQAHAGHTRLAIMKYEEFVANGDFEN